MYFEILVAHPTRFNNLTISPQDKILDIRVIYRIEIDCLEVTWHILLIRKMGVRSNLSVRQKGSTTTLKQPKELGFYSKTSSESILLGDKSNLRYYYLPDAMLESRIDLSAGFNRFRNDMNSMKDPNSLAGLLDTLMSHEKERQRATRADIVTYRGVMCRLVSAAFDNSSQAHVNLRVVSFDNQLFIKNMDTPHTTSGNNLQDTAMYTGYKFESIATLKQPLPYTERSTLEKRNKKVVSNGEEYVTVVRSGIGNSKLILGAEVDCVYDFYEDGKDNLKHYAELKCIKYVNSANDAKRFEFRLFKAWLQCFLVGLPRIIYGFRDEQNILKTVEEYLTAEIPVLLKNSNNKQLQNACIDAIKWYGLLVEWLLKMVPKIDSTHDNDIRAFKLVYADNYLRLSEIEENDDEYNDLVYGETVITNDFKEWRRKMKNEQVHT